MSAYRSTNKKNGQNTQQSNNAANEIFKHSDRKKL